MVVHVHLGGIGLMVGIDNRGLVPLHLKVIVITKQVTVPLHHLLSLIKAACRYQPWHLTAQTG